MRTSTISDSPSVLVEHELTSEINLKGIGEPYTLASELLSHIIKKRKVEKLNRASLATLLEALEFEKVNNHPGRIKHFLNAKSIAQHVVLNVYKRLPVELDESMEPADV